jgi:hypothetical protein
MSDERQKSTNNVPAKSEAKNDEEKLPSIEVGQHGAIVRTIDDMWRLARLVHKSGLAPKGFQSPEAIIVAWEYGAELGLGRMQSLHCIHVIDGVPRLNVDAALALVRASGLFDESAFVEEISDTKATCTVRRLPNGNPVTRTFTIDDARRAGLLGERKENWHKYPKRMLQVRARSWALRDAFGDVLRGLEVVGVAEEDARANVRDATLPNADVIAPAPESFSQRKIDRIAGRVRMIPGDPATDEDAPHELVTEALREQGMIAAEAATTVEDDDGDEPSLF